LQGFSKGFLWGAAAASHQVEGLNTLNDWWEFEAQGSAPEKSGDACDHYNRFEEDFDLAVALGHNAHRFSIEWSRIEPEDGRFDPNAIQHYRKVLSALRDRGMKSVMTVHHVTNPQWHPGWDHPRAAELFERYVRHVAQEIGDLVDYWITISEPTSHAFLGHGIGYWPPQRKRLWRVLPVLDTMADAHNRAYDAIHEIADASGREAMVGSSTIHHWWRPVGVPNLWQRWICGFIARVSNFHFLDKTAEKHDFFGLNHYFTFDVPKLGLIGRPTRVPASDLGWSLVPEGLAAVMRALWERYESPRVRTPGHASRPILVTEHGLADEFDEYRWWYIRESLRHVRYLLAEQAGVNLIGYLHWSLTDNYEWRYGFSPRFGLIAVDYVTQRRTPRVSARRLALVAKTGRLDAADAPGALPDIDNADVVPADMSLITTEYEAMRKEIDKADQWLLQLIFYVPWAAALVLWAGIERSDVLLTLSPLFLLVASAIGILSRIEYQMRVAAYIRSHFESRYPEFGYENFLVRAQDSDFGADGHLSWATLLLYGGVGAACVIMSWLIAETTNEKWAVGVAFLFVLLLVAFGAKEVQQLGRRVMVTQYESVNRR